MVEVLEITPAQLESMLAEPDPPAVLDVREPWELEICRVDGAQEIPMRSVPQRLQELPRGRTIAVVCHAGARSYMVAQWLLGQGYEAVSVAGGVNAWPGMAKY